LNTWIVNASPLILLGKINRLDLLERLSPAFAIPAAVCQEICAGLITIPQKIGSRAQVLALGAFQIGRSRQKSWYGILVRGKPQHQWGQGRGCYRMGIGKYAAGPPGRIDGSML